MRNHLAEAVLDSEMLHLMSKYKKGLSEEKGSAFQNTRYNSDAEAPVVEKYVNGKRNPVVPRNKN
jgi:hypothetical protein